MKVFLRCLVSVCNVYFILFVCVHVCVSNVKAVWDLTRCRVIETIYLLNFNKLFMKQYSEKYKSIHNTSVLLSLLPIVV